MPRCNKGIICILKKCLALTEIPEEEEEEETYAKLDCFTLTEKTEEREDTIAKLECEISMEDWVPSEPLRQFASFNDSTRSGRILTSLDYLKKYGPSVRGSLIIELPVGGESLRALSWDTVGTFLTSSCEITTSHFDYSDKRIEKELQRICGEDATSIKTILSSESSNSYKIGDDSKYISCHSHLHAIDVPDSVDNHSDAAPDPFDCKICNALFHSIWHDALMEDDKKKEIELACGFIPRPGLVMKTARNEILGVSAFCINAGCEIHIFVHKNGCEKLDERINVALFTNFAKYCYFISTYVKSSGLAAIDEIKDFLMKNKRCIDDAPFLNDYIKHERH